MKIKKMTAGFGCLDGRSLELGEGLNVLHAPNESGKSTWCAFVLTMLYGLNTSARERQGAKPDKVKYAPWSGVPMSGSMELEHEGRAITLRRWTEKASRPMQEFSATYTGTEDPVPGLTAETAGEILTGVSREVYERSAFIRQAGMIPGHSPELEKRIHAIVSTGEEGLSFTELDKQLRTWQRHRQSGKRGAIPETEQQITDTGETLRRIREASEQAEALQQELEQARRERDEAVRRMEQARARQRRQALEEMSRSRAMSREAEELWEQAEGRFRSREARVLASAFAGVEPERARELAEDCRWRAGELEKIAKRMPPVWISYIFLVLFVLGLGIGVLMDMAAAPIAAGCVSLVLFAVVNLRLRAMKRLGEQSMEDRRKMLAAYGAQAPEQLEGIVDAYEAEWLAMQREKKSLRAAEQQRELARLRQKEADQAVVSGLDFHHGESEAAQAGREVAAAEQRMERLREQRALAEGRARALGDPVELESELEQQKQRRRDLLEQYGALELAIETLAAADAELQNRFSPRLSEKTAEYFAFLTQGRYDEVTVARDLEAKVRPSGESVGRETDYLSEGAADQLYLALRLAVCELALPDRSCPMVLDDAMVNFDDERAVRALELIRTVAEQRQVLLFTCHERESKYFAKDPAVTLRSAAR